MNGQMPGHAQEYFSSSPSLNAASLGGIYNSSSAPSNLPWNSYNYCNAPHVNAQHYVEPEHEGVRLVYLNVMMRHHKRTPDNLYPNENSLNPSSGWDCSSFLQYSYGDSDPSSPEGTSPRIFHETSLPHSHPFLRQFWNGSCDAGQLTKGGLDDSIHHGKDFFDVYHRKLGFLDGRVTEEELYVRTSTETRTFQVAGGMLYGMDPSITGRSFRVHTQPATVDSLVPRYPCPAANDIRNAYQSVPVWTDHLLQNQDLQSRLDDTLGTAGLSAWSAWYDPFFDTFTSRTCHGHPLPCNSSGACVSQDDANRVFQIGDFEYDYIWNSAQNASNYVDLTFGVMFSELDSNFRAYQSGKEHFKARLYVGHDGSMIRLASGLGLGKNSPLRWPALGSEIVMEVWRSDQGLFVRVMHEGTPVFSLEWVPLEDFISLLESRVPVDVFEACMGR
ncbi:hypothetical protein JAAARDRAFT_41911 [Jaapia argillacea MUCL 33604]|uniref:Acid phosphatase n=1 Tax=Jaapia argillacea MUCL 33604 TaxID=933084 RepID=A0A067P752_9AGAM|nr:hypothetical protein JAAARDRAFT_41911 [Jaapia argillacea MUCL 33604]